jgi:cobalt-precorrin 5A hydrolase
MRVALIAITKHGVSHMVELAKKLTASVEDITVITSEKFTAQVEVLEAKNSGCKTIVYKGAMRPQVPDIFNSFDQLIFFVSLGAVVRLISPHLKSKEEDPGVIVVDDAKQFVIPMLSGHIGGANYYAELVADLLGATAVVTTASDVRNTIAVDILGRDLGWRVEAPKINITRVSADVVNEEPVALVQESGSTKWWKYSTPLPKNIQLYARFEDVDFDKIKSLLWITNRVVDIEIWNKLEERLVVYRPPKKITLGIGCDRNTPLSTIERAVDEALTKLNATIDEVEHIATIDKKGDEIALLEFAKNNGKELQLFSAEELAKVEVPNPSEVVMKYVGTPAVAEAAALLVAGENQEQLLIEKHKCRGEDEKNATVSIVLMKE